VIDACSDATIGVWLIGFLVGFLACIQLTFWLAKRKTSARG
jgi:hypothetical protein